MTRLLIRLTAAGVIAAVAVVGWTAYRIWDTGLQDARPDADAIVVLGAAQYDGRPSSVLKARLDHAIELYKTGVARWFVVTGGKAEGDRTTEAAAARSYALSRGVPASSILAEDQGRTTLESMRGVRTVFDGNDLSSAIFVSDRTHMLRVLRIASDLNIEAYGSPTATSPTEASVTNQLEATIREVGALGFYFLGGEFR